MPLGYGDSRKMATGSDIIKLHNQSGKWTRTCKTHRNFLNAVFICTTFIADAIIVGKYRIETLLWFVYFRRSYTEYTESLFQIPTDKSCWMLKRSGRQMCEGLLENAGILHNR